jgi:predicted small secreted protein
MKKILVLTLLMSPLALSACNTVAGAGQDIAVTGQTLTQESREIQSNL